MITGDLLPRLFVDQSLPPDSPTTEAEWGFVERMGYDRLIQRELRGDMDAWAGSASKTAEFVLNLRDHVSESVSVGHSSAPALDMVDASEEADDEWDERRGAVSVVLAREAAREARVIGFRQAHLPNGLLPLEAVGEWIDIRASQDGPPTAYVQLPLPMGTTVASGDVPGTVVLEPPFTIGAIRVGGSKSVTAHSLRYSDGKRMRSVPTAAGGVLEELRALSEFLATTYGWREHQAVVFALTGMVPWVGGIYTTMTFSPQLPATSRINLNVDPTTKADEVNAAYMEAFRELVPGRYRRLSLKHIRLAQVAALRRPHVGPKAEWGELMSEWNAGLSPESEYRYEALTNFARDCNQAAERLLRPDFRPEWVAEKVLEAGQDRTEQVRRITRSRWYWPAGTEDVEDNDSPEQEGG